MSTSPREPNAFDRYYEELKRTGVISQEFKDHLMRLMDACAREAYANGVRDAKAGKA